MKRTTKPKKPAGKAPDADDPKFLPVIEAMARDRHVTRGRMFGSTGLTVNGKVFAMLVHITRDGQDVYSWKLKVLERVVGWVGRLTRLVELEDQVEAARRIFASDTRWTVARRSDLEEGESQGLPVWSRHVGDPILESNLTRRVDFALFMVAALMKRRAGARSARDCRLPDAICARPCGNARSTLT